MNIEWQKLHQSEKRRSMKVLETLLSIKFGYFRDGHHSPESHNPAGFPSHRMLSSREQGFHMKVVGYLVG